MFLMLDFWILNDSILNIKNKEIIYSEMSTLINRSSTTCKKYINKPDSIPPLTARVLKGRLEEKGIFFSDEEACSRAYVAIGWKSSCRGMRGQAPDFCPATVNLLESLADKDLAFAVHLGGKDEAERLVAYKDYLLNDVLPFYFPEGMTLVDEVKGPRQLKDLRPLLIKILIKGTLFLLAHAEGERLASCVNQQSVLERCLPSRFQEIGPPGQRFLRQRFEKAGLTKHGYVEEMTDLFGDSEEMNGLPDKESYEKQYDRYLMATDCSPPSWDMVAKIASILRMQQLNKLGQVDSVEIYTQLFCDLYGGAKLIDRLWIESTKELSREEVAVFFSSYGDLYSSHMEKLKAAEKTASSEEQMEQLAR